MRRVAFNNILFAVVIAAGLAPSLPAFAEEQPPARVGRVSVVDGRLGFHAVGETTWSAAAVNFPVATGGAFWTDPKSRAEIRIGGQSIGLANNTELDVVRLDQQVMQIAVPQGRIELHLRQLAAGSSVEIDIPRGGVWLLQPGIYDINAGTPDRPARIMVFEGSVRFAGGSLDQGIKTGEMAVISGAETLTATIERAAPDAFVQWCRARDYREQRLAAPYHVSPRMTGYEELDAYGSWRAVPEYGEVWYPRSAPRGWAPYRDGYWTWLDPWGWNWIDAAPWGFAPSHYGRWAFLDGGWGWIPGSYIDAPVYAPALVAFLADPGSILTRAAAGPYVGWVPLGPGEAYWPSYTGDAGFIRAVNAGAVANAASLGAAPAAGMATAFANRRAATVVPQQAFATAAPVGRAALPVSGAALQNAQITARGPSRPGAAAATAGSAGAATPGGGTTGVSRGAGAAGLAASGAAGAIAARGAGPAAARFAGRGRGSALAGGRLAGGRLGRGGHFGAPTAHASRFGGARFTHAGRSNGGGAGFAARHGAPRGAPMAALHGGGPRFGGGGAPHFAGHGGPRGGGGGPRFSGGGLPHGGAAPHAGGGGGPHHGGGGGQHGGGGPHGGGKG